MFIQKRFFLLLFTLIICLPSCANKDVANGQNIKNPFVVTGLLVHSNETAEEILMRAHALDPDAIALIMAGYTFGVGGFPEDMDLSNGWNNTFQLTGQVYDSTFLSLMHIYAKDPFWKPEPGFCYAANQSFLTPLFMRAGLFDLKIICPENDYKDENYNYDRSAQYAENLKGALTRLIDNPITSDEAKLLRFTAAACNSYAGYNVAIGGNKNASISEKQLNLLQFIAQRKAESFPESSKLYDIAADTLMQLSFEEVDPQAAKEIIRKAHQGDPVAAQQMAENYFTGAMGFPHSSFLVGSWLKRAAAAGNKKALDSLVLWTYTNSIPQYAWREANIALLYGSSELRDVFAWIILETEKSFGPEELIRRQEVLNEEIKHLKASGYQTK